MTFDHMFLATGFGVHFSHLSDQLRNFTNPSVAVGWDCGSVLRHCHVLVKKNPGGIYSTVNVSLPHFTLLDQYKRVSDRSLVFIVRYLIIFILVYV